MNKITDVILVNELPEKSRFVFSKYLYELLLLLLLLLCYTHIAFARVFGHCKGQAKSTAFNLCKMCSKIQLQLILYETSESELLSNQVVISQRYHFTDSMEE